MKEDKKSQVTPYQRRKELIKAVKIIREKAKKLKNNPSEDKPKDDVNKGKNTS